MTFNGNITLPAGTTSHGTPGLLCLPTKWTDVVVFFLGNYVAHAATIRLEPGTSTVDTVLFVVRALLIPVSGVNGGIRGILSLAKFGKTDLQIAARAGALCQVIRTDEQARSHREKLLTLESVWSQTPYNLLHADIKLEPLFAGKVHGRIRLPEGYGLAILPRNSRFVGDESAAVPITLSSNYNIVSILVAVAQLAFAISTLYQSRGDQTTRYGYAAFGLTVTQYAMMSLLNLLGNAVCPQYPAVYLIRSQAMSDAEAIPNGNALFEGVVGTLVEDDLQIKEAKRRALENVPSAADLRTDFRKTFKKSWQLPLVWFPTAVSIAITYGLSRFRKGSSTLPQRAWTMAWLAVGSYLGALADIDELRRDGPTRSIYWEYFGAALTLLIFAVPSVGGFTVVVQMLYQYGICSHI
jgi:hypothetical protein